MLIQPIGKPQPTFGYKHPLKTAFDRGLMPDVKRGLLGHKLTRQNRSIEHLTPKCKGGTLAWDNVALTDKVANNQRALKPIEEVVTKDMWIDYLKQFVNVKNSFVDGVKYIKGLCKRFKINTKEVMDV